MTDLVGTRCVVLTGSELDPICQWIESTEGWTSVRSRDFQEEIERNPKLFDYQSHHFEIRPSANLNLPEGTITPDVCCEVQVRTLLQHAYAELVHNNIYKADGRVPSQAERLVARSMALMETTDELFCKALDAITDTNRPLTLLLRMAEHLAGDLDGPGARSTGMAIVEGFRDAISEESANELRTAVEANPHWLERIDDRLGQGLFEFRGASLLTYWLGSKLESDIVTDWPLPASKKDVTRVLSDLGIAE